MKALVLGGTGAVGRATITALHARGHDTTATGRSTQDVGSARLDLRGRDAAPRLHELSRDHDVVINASGIEDPTLVTACVDAPFVDISATGRYLAALAGIDRRATTVIGAGIAPGLSTLLADALTSSDGDDIDIAVMLGTGEVHGPAAISWTAELAGQDVHAAPEGRAVRNYRERRVFFAAGRRRTHLRADFPDNVLLPRLRVRSYLALSSGPATAALSVVGIVPALRGLLSASPHWGDDRWEVSATNRRTRETLSAWGHAQATGTGEMTALAAIMAAERRDLGAVSMADMADLGLLEQATQISAVLLPR